MKTIFLFGQRNPTAYAFIIIAILVLGVALWFTKGIAFGYMQSKLSDKAKSAIVAFHVLISFILALALPNNYLNEFPFFELLYKSSEWWIPVTMFILLLFLIIVLGLFVSIIFRPTGNSIINPKPETDEVTNAGYLPYRLRFSTLAMVSIGAFIFWLLSGFKGKFNDLMSRYYESDQKFDKNYFVGFAIILIIIASVITIIS